MSNVLGDVTSATELNGRDLNNIVVIVEKISKRLPSLDRDEIGQVCVLEHRIEKKSSRLSEIHYIKGATAVCTDLNKSCG